jgi:hypothetical protein
MKQPNPLLDSADTLSNSLQKTWGRLTHYLEANCDYVFSLFLQPQNVALLITNCLLLLIAVCFAIRYVRLERKTANILQRVLKDRSASSNGLFSGYLKSFFCRTNVVDRMRTLVRRVDILESSPPSLVLRGLPITVLRDEATESVDNSERLVKGSKSIQEQPKFSQFSGFISTHFLAENAFVIYEADAVAGDVNEGSNGSKTLHVTELKGSNEIVVAVALRGLRGFFHSGDRKEMGARVLDDKASPLHAFGLRFAVSSCFQWKELDKEFKGVLWMGYRGDSTPSTFEVRLAESVSFALAHHAETSSSFIRLNGLEEAMTR